LGGQSGRVELEALVSIFDIQTTFVDIFVSLHPQVVASGQRLTWKRVA
jgi:hypothetical protein